MTWPRVGEVEVAAGVTESVVEHAVQVCATVPNYYESRLARLALDEAVRPNIDSGFEEATEGEEVERKEKLKTRWAQLEAVVGADKRLELVRTVRAYLTIDWTLRENVRAQLRVLVKRILRKYGYPPDKQEKATETVLEQAALLSAEWAAEPA